MQPTSTHYRNSRHEERMKWWTEARFGMFIHWGIYSLPARHEWVKRYEKATDEEYQRYFERFNPDLFEPAIWARAAKKAGMKYFVVTAKHHDGFCLWDTKHTDFKVTNTPHGKDVLRPIVEAFRAEGLRVGLYYSLLDWHNPDYPIDRNHPMYENEEFRKKERNRDISKYQQYMKNQLTELLTDFGKIDCLFLDYSFTGGKDGKGRDDWDSKNLLSLVRRLQPKIIVNDRLDLLDQKDGWDFRSPEHFNPREWVEMDGRRVPWETCQTFSGSWGYHRDESTWRSMEQLLFMLIDTVAKGGNLLLNVGPNSRGEIDSRAMERLNAMGEWMRVHSRSIYGCTQAPAEFKKPDNCLLTYNEKTRRLYAHVLVWPLGRLCLDGYAGKIRYAQLLNDGSEVKSIKPKPNPIIEEKVGDDVLILELPVRKPDVAIPVVEMYLN